MFLLFQGVVLSGSMLVFKKFWECTLALVFRRAVDHGKEVTGGVFVGQMSATKPF